MGTEVRIDDPLSLSMRLINGGLGGQGLDWVCLGLGSSLGLGLGLGANLCARLSLAQKLALPS